MIRPLFALEDVVLYVFVAVQSFFFWIFSSVYSRAMNVHDLFNLPRPQSASPRIAADSSSSPSAPADVAPALPRIPGINRVAGRSIHAVVGRPRFCCVPQKGFWANATLWYPGDVGMLPTQQCRDRKLPLKGIEP
ncbi:unnamed protein product [Ectocarpus fasciculatus]